VSVAQPLNGGSGGRVEQDGIDGSSFTGGWLRNIPNEVLEADMPVLVEEYGYRPGSAGAGKYRGGAGIRFRMKTLAPETLMTARGLERFVFRPWGLRGGRPGELSRAVLNPGSAHERDLGKIDVLFLESGDVVQFDTASGGGLGHPFDRLPERVLADVEAGMVSLEEAGEHYGVVITDNCVDAAATAELRSQRPTDDGLLVDVGPERRAHEAIWSEEVLDAMVQALKPYPGRLRPALRGRVLRWVDQLGRSPEPCELPRAVVAAAQEMGVAVPAEAAPATS
jgi:N-methylhydantoinase B